MEGLRVGCLTEVNTAIAPLKPGTATMWLTGCVVVYVQREKGMEKFDIALQKLDQEDAASDLLMKMEEKELEHYNYSKVQSVLSHCYLASRHLRRSDCWTHDVNPRPWPWS